MRIISGKFKGTQLNSFEFDNIRPTTDRVRENIFNKIAFDIKESYVLDLFGGTGAVSLEFISRGAKVVTVDNNENSVKLIKKNFEKCKTPANLMFCDYKKALKMLKEKGQKFDFVFLDPPFESQFGQVAMQLISDYDLLNSDGVIIFEHLTGKKFDIPENFEIKDEKKYGTISVSYLGLVNENC